MNCNMNLIEIRNKKVLNKIRYFSELISRVMIEIEYKKVIKKLRKYDLIADVDDQRFHHFSS